MPRGARGCLGRRRDAGRAGRGRYTNVHKDKHLKLKMARKYGTKLEAARREMLEARVKQNEIWAKKFDDKIVPFEKKYVTLTDGISGIYENAKAKHKIGIKVLQKEFNYHPLWKLNDGDFSATPFEPM